MDTFFGINPMALFGQLLVGLINGSFYALLSLGLAIIFGLLRIINFAQGALYMVGAFLAWLGLQHFGINYWLALIIVPVVVGIVGVLIEKFLIRPIAHEDHLYGLLLTFGLALIIQGTFTHLHGSSGLPYQIPEVLSGGLNLGFVYHPIYRGGRLKKPVWVLICGRAQKTREFCKVLV